MKKYTTTLGELWNTLRTLNTLNIINDVSCTVKGSYAIADNITKIQNVLKTYDDKRTALIRKYSDGKDSISPEDKNWDKFCAELNELNAIEAVVPDLRTIELDDIVSGVTPAKIMAIKFMIEEPTEPSKVEE